MLGMLPWFSVPVNAQRRGWSAPFEVSEKMFGWFPDVAVAPDGSVHIVWYSGIDKGKPEDFRDLLAYRELRGGQWSPPNSVAAPAVGGYTVRNGLVMGRDGRLHAVMRSGARIMYSSAPWQEAWSARAWSPPRTLGEGYYDGLAIDSKGTLHVIWTGSGKDDPQKVDQDCTDCNELYYRRSIDGGATWSAPINLSKMPGGEDKPQIKVDQQDRIHVFWDHGFDWYTGKGKPQIGLYRRSDDGGLTWNPPTKFSIPDGTIEQTSVATTASSQMLVVYRDAENSDVYYQASANNGGSWKVPTKIPGVLARNSGDPPLDIYSLATDSANQVHLLMVGFRSADESEQGIPSLLHLVWNGVFWSQPEVIMSSHYYPEWPRLVVFAGNQLHAVWFTRDQLYGTKDEHVPLRVWYSSKLLSTPAAIAVPLFTPTPPPAPTVTPTPASTPTTLPTALPSAVLETPPVDGAPAWEGPGLAIATITTLVTAAFLGGLLGIMLWIRRRRA